MARGFSAQLERRASPENPNTPLTSAKVAEWLGGMDTTAGVPMTEKRALLLPAVFAAHQIIADSGIGTLPRKVVERLPNGGRRPRPDHWLWDLVSRRPNPELPDNELFAMGTHHILGWGSTFFEIQRTRDQSQIVGLWPLLPDRTRAVRENGVKEFETRLPNGNLVRLPAERVLQVPGLSFDGLTGYGPLRLARESLALAEAAQQFGSRLFRQGLNPGGFLEHPDNLSDGAQQRLREKYERLSGGLSNAHRMMVLEEGMKFTAGGTINPDDAQALETRKFQVLDIARIYQTPAHMLADTERPFQSNVEALGIEFVVYALRRWLVRWEKRLQELLPEEERASLAVRFMVDGLLRGDKASRSESYKIAVQGGWMTPNEVRELEDQNPLELGSYGDSILVQQNQVLIGPDGNPTPLSAQPERGLRATPEWSLPYRQVPEDNGDWPRRPGGQLWHPRAERRDLHPRVKLREAFLPVLERDATRLVAGETRAVRRAVEEMLRKGDVEAFHQWLVNYYKKTQGFAADTMRGSALAMLMAIAREALNESEFEVTAERFDETMTAFGEQYLETFAERYTGSSEGQIRQLIEDQEPAAGADLVIARLDEWTERRPGKVGMNESTRIGGAAALYAFATAGVVRMTWRNVSKSCPLCSQLEGATVEIHGSFARPGDTIKGNDDTADLVVRHLIRHPPLHGGCDCFITGG